MAAKIVIKIKDAFFLQEITYTDPVNAGKLVIGTNFPFQNSADAQIAKNFDNLNGIYPNIKNAGNISESQQVFAKLITMISGLATNGKLESLFSVIDATDAINLMRKAHKRSDYIGENLLNFYSIEVNSRNVAQKLNEINELKISTPILGIDYAYIRGELASFEQEEVIPIPIDFSLLAPEPIIGDIIDSETLKKIIEQQPNQMKMAKKNFETAPKDSSQMLARSIETTLPITDDIYVKAIFNTFDIYNKENLTSTSPTKPTIKVVDIEQGWNFDKYSIAGITPLRSKPILGGGINYSEQLHGQKTLSVLFGSETPDVANTLNGLCEGADALIASTWYDKTSGIEYREAALTSVLGFTTPIGKIKPLNVGDVVLLELQVKPQFNIYPVPIKPEIPKTKKSKLPVEIEPLMWGVIKAGVYAGFIIIEPAGNDNNDLNIVPNYATNLPLRNVSNKNKTTCTEAIMVGAKKKDSSIFLNNGNRIDFNCYGEEVFTSASAAIVDTVEKKFSSTSLASAITAALVANIQSIAQKNIALNRRLTISELKLLLSTPMNVNTFISNSIASNLFNYSKLILP